MSPADMLERGRLAVAALEAVGFCDVSLGVQHPCEVVREVARLAGGPEVVVTVYPASQHSWMPARRVPYVIETWEEGEWSKVKLRIGSAIRPATAEEIATLEVTP